MNCKKQVLHYKIIPELKNSSKKAINYMSNGQAMIIHLLTGLIRKMWFYKMSRYFPRSHQRFDGDISVELDLLNYATKADLKEVTGVHTSDLAANSDLVRLKA